MHAQYKCVTYILYSMLTIAILHIVYYFCYNLIMRLKHHTVKLDTLRLHYSCTWSVLAYFCFSLLCVCRTRKVLLNTGQSSIQ